MRFAFIFFLGIITQWLAVWKICSSRFHFVTMTSGLNIWEREMQRRKRNRGRRRESDRQTGWQRVLPSAGSVLKCLQWPRLEQTEASMQQLSADLPLWVIRICWLEPSLLLPTVCLSRKLELGAKLGLWCDLTGLFTARLNTALDLWILDLYSCGDQEKDMLVGSWVPRKQLKNKAPFRFTMAIPGAGC